MTSNGKELVLESLADGIPAITDEMVGFYKQNCMVCFHHNGHKSGVRLRVKHGDEDEYRRVLWSGEVTEEVLRAIAEPTQATNHGACAIALLLLRELTEFTAVEQAVIGTAFDYHIALKGRLKGQSDDLPFNDTTRMEVSGLRNETPSNTVKRRLKEKIDRLKPKGSLPALIVIVEFSEPWSTVVRYG